MGASALYRGAGGLSLAAAVLLALTLLCSCFESASAQNYTVLRGGVWLPPQCSIDNETATRELDSLLQKLPQVKGTRAEGQLQFLATSSRSKLNNLTGNAAEWLRNRTDVELEELFETIRAENFRRMMAMGAIGTQLKQVFTSSNVLRSIELLQTDDLERFASLPLFEERYQKLTNVTFLELLRQMYSFGLTQVPERTCVRTAGNTSAISRLPNSDPTTAVSSASTVATTPTSPSQADIGFAGVNFAAIKPDKPATTYSLMPNDGRTFVSGHRRRHAAKRRSLLSVLSDAARSWSDMEHDEAVAAVVQEVTRGPGSASPHHLRRMLLQSASIDGTSGSTATTSTTPTDHTLAPIVTKFLDSLGVDGSLTSTTTTTGDGTGGETSLLGSATGIPGVPTQPGFLDSRALTTGCTENLGLYRLRTASSSSAGAASTRTSGSSTKRSGSGGGSSSMNTSPTKVANSTLAPPTGAVAVNCTDGLVFNGTGCVPCPPNTVLEGSACVCANTTVFNATTGACDPLPAAAPCVNGTLADGVTPCTPTASSPSADACVNGTRANGTLCDSSSLSTLLLPPATAPCVNGSLPNGTACSSPPGAIAPLAPLVDVNGSLLAPNGSNIVDISSVSLPINDNSSLALGVGVGAANNNSQADAGNNNTATSLPAGPYLAPVNTTDPGVTPSTPPGLNVSAVGGGPAVVEVPIGAGNINSSSNNPIAAPGLVPPATEVMPPPTTGDANRSAPIDPAAVPPAAVGITPPAADVTTPLPSPAVTPVAGDPTAVVVGAAAAPSPSLPAVNTLPATDVTLLPGQVTLPGQASVVTPTPGEVGPVATVPEVSTTAPATGATPTTPGAVADPSALVTPTAVVPPQQPVQVAPVQVAPTVVVPEAVPQVPATPTPVAVAPVVEVVAVQTTPVAKQTVDVLPPVNCVGSWQESGTCNAPCEGTGTKTSIYTITTPAANGGAACEAASGATRELPCSNPTACPKPPVNCVGAWQESGTCNAPCEGTGTKTSIYTITTPAANGGAACEAASGAARELPCSNPTACPKPPVNCVGSWQESGTCNAPCEGTGTKTSIYTVTTPAANGGAACEAASGATREVPCSNPTACPKPQVAVEPTPVAAPVAPPPVTPPPAVVAPTVVPDTPKAEPAPAAVAPVGVVVAP